MLSVQCFITYQQIIFNRTASVDKDNARPELALKLSITSVGETTDKETFTFTSCCWEEPILRTNIDRPPILKRFRYLKAERLAQKVWTTRFLIEPREDDKHFEGGRKCHNV